MFVPGNYRILILVANTGVIVILDAVLVTGVIIQISRGFVVTGVKKRTGLGFG